MWLSGAAAKHGRFVIRRHRALDRRRGPQARQAIQPKMDAVAQLTFHGAKIFKNEGKFEDSCSVKWQCPRVRRVGNG